MKSFLSVIFDRVCPVRLTDFTKLLGLLFLATALGVASAASADPVRLAIDSGPVIGEVAAGVAVFKGLPYAAPPVGDLRWRAPRPPTPWREDLVASDYGPSCMQAAPPRFVSPSSRAATLSENCLTLNVWAPTHATKAPVIVWIHGGGNDSGTASQTFYDGTAFARDGVVLVSMNYRLGLLGFFAHPALVARNGDDPTANYGLMDQIAALKWVARNITAFGGDPGRVTVMGESAGGQDILALMASPLARGLFQQAIIESAGGGWWPAPSLAEAEADGGQTAVGLGLSGVKVGAQALLALPASALVAPGAPSEIGPVVDGRLLPEPSLAAIGAGRAAPIPMIIGTNGGEGSILGPDPKPGEIFPKLAPDDLARLRGLYGPPAPTDEAFASLLFRDGYFAGPAWWVAGRQAAAGAPVYVYRFDYVMSLLRPRRPVANHGSEIPFVFETGPQTLLSADDRLVTAAMHDCWVAFALAGAPRCASAPSWPAHGAQDLDWMVFDTAPGMRPAPTAILDALQHKLAP